MILALGCDSVGLGSRWIGTGPVNGQSTPRRENSTADYEDEELRVKMSCYLELSVKKYCA